MKRRQERKENIKQIKQKTNNSIIYLKENIPEATTNVITHLKKQSLSKYMQEESTACWTKVKGRPDSLVKMFKKVMPYISLSFL